VNKTCAVNVRTRSFVIVEKNKMKSELKPSFAPQPEKPQHYK